MPAPRPTPADRRAFDEQGYVIFRGAFTPARIAELRGALDRLVDRGLRDEIELPWIDRAAHKPGRLANLLAPDRFDPAYSAWVDEDLLDTLESLIGGPARHSLFGTLISGAGQAYVQGWHRDLVNPTDQAAVPAMKWMHERALQFNAPLLPGDRFLQIVPGSHLRGATPDEAAAYAKDPAGPLPGQTTVETERGDVVYYDFNLWHRGYNPHGEERLSMHAAFWRAGTPVMAHEAGQADELRKPGHLDRLTPRTRATVDHYLADLGTGEPVTAQVLATKRSDNH